MKRNSVSVNYGDSKILSVNDLYIGKGVIIYDNRIVISLDHVVTARMNRAEDMSYGGLWKVLGIGLLAVTIGLIGRIPLIIIGGIATIVYALYKIYKVYKYNSIKEYKVVLELSNGEKYFYYHKDLEFVRKVMNVLIECINDRNSGYKIVNSIEKIEYSQDNSITNGPNVVVNGSAEGINIGSTTHVSGGSSYTNSEKEKEQIAPTEILESEWKELEKFMLKRQEETELSEEVIKRIGELIKYVEKKDRKSFRTYCVKIGNEGINTIFSRGVSKANKEIIFPIVKKLISSK